MPRYVIETPEPIERRCDCPCLAEDGDGYNICGIDGRYVNSFNRPQGCQLRGLREPTEMAKDTYISDDN